MHANAGRQGRPQVAGAPSRAQRQVSVATTGQQLMPACVLGSNQEHPVHATAGKSTVPTCTHNGSQHSRATTVS